MMDDCTICTPEEQVICLCRYPEFAYFRSWALSPRQSERDHVRQRSRIGYTPPPEPEPGRAPAAGPAVAATAPVAPSEADKEHERAAILARRAAKPRGPLGTKLYSQPGAG